MKISVIFWLITYVTDRTSHLERKQSFRLICKNKQSFEDCRIEVTLNTCLYISEKSLSHLYRGWSGMINKPSQKSASPIDFAASLYSKWVRDFPVSVFQDGIFLSWSCTLLMWFPWWKCMTKKSQHYIDFPLLNRPIVM